MKIGNIILEVGAFCHPFLNECVMRINSVAPSLRLESAVNQCVQQFDFFLVVSTVQMNEKHLLVVSMQQFLTHISQLAKIYASCKVHISAFNFEKQCKMSLIHAELSVSCTYFLVQNVTIAPILFASPQLHLGH